MRITDLLIVCAVAIACVPEFYVIRPTVIRFASGDSVFFVATGPIFEPKGDTGMMYEYHSFIPLQDTARLRAQAIDLWTVVGPRADSLKVPFVVLRATTRFTELRGVPQPDTVWNFGFVLQRHEDGQWYFWDNGRLVQH